MPGPGLDLVGDEELAELTDVIRSGRLSRYGPDDDTFPAKVRTFEEAVAERAGVRHALAVNAGTSALYLALIGLGRRARATRSSSPASPTWPPSPRSSTRGPTPVLAEVDATFDLDPADVEARITPRTRAIVVVHMLGSAGAHRRAPGGRRAPRPARSSRMPPRPSAPPTAVAGSARSATPAPTASTSTRPSPRRRRHARDRATMALYRRCFAMHDQGQVPDGSRSGRARVPGAGPQLPHDRGAGRRARGPAAQARPHPRAPASPTATACGGMLEGLPGIGFRELTDRDGDLATHLVVIFPDAAAAAAVTETLGSITLDHSGWHVYSQMEHLLAQTHRDRTGLSLRLRVPRQRPLATRSVCFPRPTRCWHAR